MPKSELIMHAAGRHPVALIFDGVAPEHIDTLWLLLQQAHKLGVIPPWLCSLRVSEPENFTSRAGVRTQPQYRCCHLLIGSAFWSDHEAERWDTILHEFAHTLHAPLMSFVEELIERLGPDTGPFRDWVKSAYEHALEQSTCDIVAALNGHRFTPRERNTQPEADQC